MTIPELVGIDLRRLGALPVGNEKSAIIEGNFLLAAQQVFNWYEQRQDYITFKGAPSREKAYLDEVQEYEHEKHVNFDYILKKRKGELKWYEDPISNTIWDLASEAADVAIVGASELQRMGFPPDWVASLWGGEFDKAEFRDEWIQDYRDFIVQTKTDFSKIKVDLAEAILLKSSINEQHYVAAFWPWLHVVKYGNENDKATFSRRLRQGVGNRNSHQMPALDITPVGESTLSRAQKSPFSSDGYAPKAFEVKDTEIWVNPGDFDNVYDGMYSVGMVQGLYDLTGHRFDHNPEMADYAWHYAKPEWRSVMSRIKDAGVSELIVPSGSGFRYKALQSLSKFEGLEFEHLGQVEDELLYVQYINWCGEEFRAPDIFEYQMFVAEGKQIRLGIMHDFLDKSRHHEGLVVGMDEIVVWWNDKIKKFEPIEKPLNEQEAVDQILRLVSGAQFFVSNATVVSHLQVTKPGEGFAVQLIPMRIECKDDDERLNLASVWLERYQKAARKEGNAKVTPGAVSLMSDFLQPYIRVRLPDSMDKMVLPFGENEKYVDHMKRLMQEDEYKFLDLPEKVQNELGISIGGFSLIGARIAFERYLFTSAWLHPKALDHYRARRLQMLQSMMHIEIK